MKRWSVNFVGVLVNAAVVFSAAFAQEPGGSVSRVVRLNRAPVNKEVLKVRLPRPMETRLANGLAVLVLERHKLPTVTFSLWVKTGALADPKDLPGLAHFTADMLREGTARRTSAQLAAETEHPLVVYHPVKRQEGLRDGTLKQLFEDEIKKSWEEYSDQVGREVAESTSYFKEALNEILAGGRQIF